MNDVATPIGGETALHSFVGGERIGLWNATWPLARLDVYGDRIQIGPSIRPLLVLVPTWKARFKEITEVRSIGKIDFFSSGIRFRSSGASNYVVFWTFRRPEILNTLESVGLAVDREPVRFSYLNPNRD